MTTQSVVDEEAARGILGQHWDVPASSVFVAEATLRGCAESRVFVGSQGLGPRAFACAVGDRWFVIPSASKERGAAPSTAAASAVLAAEPTLLDRLDASELADSMRKLIGGPSAVVASAALLSEVDPSGGAEADPEHLEPIDVWTRGGSREARALFRRLCESPVFAREGDAWSLRFGAFTSTGAFERWIVEGRGPEITSARQAEVCGAGTFRFPYG